MERVVCFLKNIVATIIACLLMIISLSLMIVAVFLLMIISFSLMIAIPLLLCYDAIQKHTINFVSSKKTG